MKKNVKNRKKLRLYPENKKMLDKIQMKGLMKYGAEAGRQKNQLTRIITFKTFPV